MQFDARLGAHPAAAGWMCYFAHDSIYKPDTGGAQWDTVDINYLGLFRVWVRLYRVIKFELEVNLC
jgi:hypothetical protein